MGLVGTVDCNVQVPPKSKNPDSKACCLEGTYKSTSLW
jgi:hypothetical protein